MHSSNEINWWQMGSEFADRPAFGWYSLTFLMFVIILFYAVRKPLMLYLEARSKDIRTAIEEAKRAKADADQKLKEYDGRLAGLDQELEKMRADFAKQGELEKAELLKAAEKLAEQIGKDAEEQISAELRQAKNQLRAEAVELASNLATKELAHRVSPDMQREFRNTFVNDLKEIRH